MEEYVMLLMFQSKEYFTNAKSTYSKNRKTSDINFAFDVVILWFS